jgi:phosphoserine phosphatase RsbU/P
MPADRVSAGGVRLGLPEKLFVVAAVVCAIVWLTGMSAGAKLLNALVTGLLAFIVAWRVGLQYSRSFLWRLRNRLGVAYIFIAVIPIILLLILGQLGTWVLTRQIGTYLLDTEMDRRVNTLRVSAERMVNAPPQARAEAVRRTGYVSRERNPGYQVVMADKAGHRWSYPEDSTLQLPPEGHKLTSGLVALDNAFYLWATAQRDDARVVMILPVTRALLAQLVPGLDVNLKYFATSKESHAARSVRTHTPIEGETAPAQPRPAAVPSLLQSLDWSVPGLVRLPLAIWDEPEAEESAMLGVVSPISTILGLVFQDRSAPGEPDMAPMLVGFYTAGVAFLILQLVSIAIGISLTRTITSAVHHLYEGTTRVMEGDFQHRIPGAGHDQLAELGYSFNRMTENLETLLKSEKERQRMQAELEIAREVQSQLHPKTIPGLGSLRLTSLCSPARMVSGDYYDYQKIDDTRLAVAIGDVAGKGISAALLMASLQSAMRSQLRHCADVSSDNGSRQVVSTARLVEHLNDQLYDSTSPEKYATFFFSVYDDSDGILRYTNAGHLPPMLFRGEETITLEVDGMVVGAFAGVAYGASQVQLQKGDLLLCYTDGLTEPDNAYGEMFGEERLFDLVRRNRDRPEAEIVSLIVQSVRDWTNSPELQDDMTMLLARKL